MEVNYGGPPYLTTMNQMVNGGIRLGLMAQDLIKRSLQNILKCGMMNK